MTRLSPRLRILSRTPFALLVPVVALVALAFSRGSAERQPMRIGSGAPVVAPASIAAT